MGLWNFCKKAAAGWASGITYVFSSFDKDAASDVCEELAEKWNIDGQAQLTKERKIKEEISEKDNTIKELLKEVKELRKEANQSKNKEQKKEKTRTNWK